MSTLFKPSRRTLIKSAAASSLFLAAPMTLRAQPALVRKSLATSESDSDVATYRAAVKFMLTKAEPDDPEMFHLNWYRNAMIHLLDCPHGNWWFAVWHRPYLAYLEKKIRGITGNEEFALPFWDWTVQPKIPEAFLSNLKSLDPDLKDNPLDPGSSYYVHASYDATLNDAVNKAKTQAAWESAHKALVAHTFPPFDAKYRSVFEDVWNTFTPAQLAQLTTRFGAAPGQSSATFDWFWNGTENSVRNNFQWDVETARFLKFANPDLPPDAAVNVEKSTIDASVRSPHFRILDKDDPGYGFNTIEGDTHHSGSRSQAILEGLPHNQVHNFTGSTMQSNLSSVDPIFFVHHSNVDRIWDVWTRRQQGLTPPRPFTPEKDAAKFNNEEFLFYIHPDGAPVTAPTTAGKNMGKAQFAYTYAPGTGEDQIGQKNLFAGVVTEAVSANAAFALEASAVASVQLSGNFASALADTQPSRHVLAELTVALPISLAGLSLRVFVSPKGVAPDTSDGSPELAGSIGFFGMRFMDHSKNSKAADEPARFDVDVTNAINRLTQSGIMQPGAEIDVTVVPVRADGGVRSAAPVDGILQSVRLKTI